MKNIVADKREAQKTDNGNGNGSNGSTADGPHAAGDGHATTNVYASPAVLQEYGMPPEVLAAIADRGRLCPMLADACMISSVRNRRTHPGSGSGSDTGTDCGTDCDPGIGTGTDTDRDAGTDNDCDADAPGQTQDGCLIMRDDGEEIEIDAPIALLKKVFHHCDGSHSMNDILAKFGDAQERQTFSDFLEFLLGQGVLIDASLATLRALRHARLSSRSGMAAPAGISGKICRRFKVPSVGPALPEADLQSVQDGHEADGILVESAPLAGFFDRRVTRYTFAETAPAESVLLQLLWSLAGVVRYDHPRLDGILPQRTIASAGGMHLLEIFLVLNRPVGRYGSGVYRLIYPAPGRVSLRPLGDDAKLLPRAFSRPWEAVSAAGAIFIAADVVAGAMRYRNRSLQYLFMEAGAALQNGALSAAGLGLGFATIGSFHETVAASICRLEDRQVLAAALFGTLDDATAERRALGAPQFDFDWIASEPARLPAAVSVDTDTDTDTEIDFRLDFFMARARLKQDGLAAGNQRPYCWGRDRDPLLAMRKALAETIEREGFRQPRDIRVGRIADIAGAIDPRRFVRYNESQYDGAFGYHRFDAERSYPWVGGIDLASGEPVRVLAELVFTRSSLEAAGFAVPFPYTQVSSSGCAAGETVADATRRALLEVIERDAFMRFWLAQSPGRTIAPGLLPAELASRIDRLRASGCRVQVQQLPSPWGRVALVAAQHERRQFTTMGTAAAACLVDAVDAAYEETAARVHSWLNGFRSSIRRPFDVASTQDHFALYGLPAYFRRADAVLFPEQGCQPDELPLRSRAGPGSGPVRDRQFLEEALAGLSQNGQSPVAVDITPTPHHVDQGRTALHVIKVLVPGLVPVSFGFSNEPRGMVAKVHPAACFPHPFP